MIWLLYSFGCKWFCAPAGWRKCPLMSSGRVAADGPDAKKAGVSLAVIPNGGRNGADHKPCCQGWFSRLAGHHRVDPARDGHHLWPLAGGVCLGDCRADCSLGTAVAVFFHCLPQSAAGRQLRAVLRHGLSALHDVHGYLDQGRCLDPLLEAAAGLPARDLYRHHSQPLSAESPDASGGLYHRHGRHHPVL